MILSQFVRETGKTKPWIQYSALNKYVLPFLTV